MIFEQDFRNPYSGPDLVAATPSDVLGPLIDPRSVRDLRFTPATTKHGHLKDLAIKDSAKK